MATQLPLQSSGFQFPIAFGEDLHKASFQPVFGRDVTDRTVETDGIVMIDVTVDEPPGILHRQWHAWTNTFRL